MPSNQANQDGGFEHARRNAIGSGSSSTTTAEQAPVTTTTTATSTVRVTTAPKSITKTKTVTVKPPPPTATTTVRVTPQPKRAIPGDGTFLVGSQVVPGTHQSGDNADCYFARLSNLSGGFDAIIANGNGAHQIVTISSTDKAFQTAYCGGWTRVQ